MEQLESLECQRSKRITQAIDRYDTWVSSDQVNLGDGPNDDSSDVLFLADGAPSSYHEARACKEKLKWNAYEEGDEITHRQQDLGADRES